MQPVQPMLATSHSVPKLICMDSENYFQLIRGTNSSKKQPRATKGEDKKVEFSTSWTWLYQRLLAWNVVSKQLFHSIKENFRNHSLQFHFKCFENTSSAKLIFMQPADPMLAWFNNLKNCKFPSLILPTWVSETIFHTLKEFYRFSTGFQHDTNRLSKGFLQAFNRLSTGF